MNRRGIIKIIEASVAILIVASVLFINYNKGIVVETPDYSENARDILEELANNVGMREEILDTVVGNSPVDASPEILIFIGDRKPGYLSSSAKICEVGGACGQSEFLGEVFSAERIISSDLDTYDPKKIRLFLWVTQ